MRRLLADTTFLREEMPATYLGIKRTTYKAVPCTRRGRPVSGGRGKSMRRSDKTAYRTHGATHLHYQHAAAKALSLFGGRHRFSLSRKERNGVAERSFGQDQKRNGFKSVFSQKRKAPNRKPFFFIPIIRRPAKPSQPRWPSPARRRGTARSARSASRSCRGTGSWSAGRWRSSSAPPRGTPPR